MGVGGKGVGEAGTGVKVGTCVSVDGSEVTVGSGVIEGIGDVADGASGMDVSVALGWQPATVKIAMETRISHVEIFIVPPKDLLPLPFIRQSGC